MKTITLTDQQFEDVQAAVLYLLVAIMRGESDAEREARFQALHGHLIEIEYAEAV